MGAGTVGAPVAHRLAETGQTAALVEAGSIEYVPRMSSSQNRRLTLTARLAMQLQPDPKQRAVLHGKDPNDTTSLVDWNFVTTPQAGSNLLEHAD
jgi:glycine/D-amino acid oxidase-like deaminating enzyme